MSLHDETDFSSPDFSLIFSSSVTILQFPDFPVFFQVSGHPDISGGCGWTVVCYCYNRWRYSTCCSHWVAVARDTSASTLFTAWTAHSLSARRWRRSLFFSSTPRPSCATFTTVCSLECCPPLPSRLIPAVVKPRILLAWFSKFTSAANSVPLCSSLNSGYLWVREWVNE